MESLSRTTPHEDAVGQETNGNGEVIRHLELVEAPSFYRRRVKPMIDVVGGLVLLVIMSPLILLTVCIVRLSLGSPVIYRQERIGKDGRPFQLYKFRTMIPDRRTRDDGYEGPERRQDHKTRHDPRVRPIGRVLRAIRFDELPQLLNVVRGDMSLVGPRPEMPQIVADYDGWQHRRHEVKPGLTGLWQVSAQNGKPMHECTDVDLEYIKTMSFKLDLSILLRTPSAMFRRRGY